MISNPFLKKKISTSNRPSPAKPTTEIVIADDESKKKAERDTLMHDRFLEPSKDVFVNLSDLSSDSDDSGDYLTQEDLAAGPMHKIPKITNGLEYLVKDIKFPNKQCSGTAFVENAIKFNDKVCPAFIVSDSPTSSGDSDVEMTAIERKVTEEDDVIFVDDGVAHKQLEQFGELSGMRKRKRKSDKRFPQNPELRTNPDMFKYWNQRYDIFERFDMGIKLDNESWYSVTPEYIAREQADMCKDTDVVLDAFCGAAGNTIQFSYKCAKVFACDISSAKVDLARHNCFVYGVEKDKVDFVCEDFYKLAETFCNDDKIVKFPHFDVVFLSPPWGGVNYNDQQTGKFDANKMQLDKLLTAARKFKARVVMVFMPRQTPLDNMVKLALANESLSSVTHNANTHDKKEMRKNKKNRKVKALTFVYTRS